MTGGQAHPPGRMSRDGADRWVPSTRRLRRMQGTTGDCPVASADRQVAVRTTLGRPAPPVCVSAQAGLLDPESDQQDRRRTVLACIPSIPDLAALAAGRGEHPESVHPEWCSSTATHAKGAKELRIFKGLIWKNSEIQLENFDPAALLTR